MLGLDRLGTRVTNALNGCFLLNLLDDSVADLLCLQTCTHGTSPKCYNSIMKVGADPLKGGTGGENGLYSAFGCTHDTNAEAESGWNCKKRFFVFLHDCPEPIKRWQPRFYSIAACIGENCSEKQNILNKVLSIVISFFEGLCSPSLKFRFRPDSATKFEWDQTFSQKIRIAGFTEQPISPDQIGLYGSLSEGINPQWGARVRANPMQFGKGLLKLVATIVLAVSIVFLATQYAIIAKILLVYAAVKVPQILGRVLLPLTHRI